MERRRPNVEPRLAAALVIAASVLVLYGVVLAAASREVAKGLPIPSTFSGAPQGLRVLARYLDELGYRQAALQRFDELPSRGTLVIASDTGFMKQPSEADAERLASWVERGGRLILVGAGCAELAGRLDPTAGVMRSSAATLEPSFPSAYLDGVSTLVWGPERVEVDGSRWVTLAGDAGGEAIVVGRFGAGEVVWVSSTYPFSNEGIVRDDNARLALTLLTAREPVSFDEYHHGFVVGGGVLDRVGVNGRLALALLGVALLVWLAARGRRLGPPIDETIVPLARTGAHVASLAALYQRAGARQEALVQLREALVRALARRYGSVSLGVRRHPSAGEALVQADALIAADPIDERAFTEVARRIVRARREVER